MLVYSTLAADAPVVHPVGVLDPQLMLADLPTRLCTTLPLILRAGLRAAHSMQNPEILQSDSFYLPLTLLYREYD